jgi:hypothetical protein
LIIDKNRQSGQTKNGNSGCRSPSASTLFQTVPEMLPARRDSVRLTGRFDYYNRSI